MFFFRKRTTPRNNEIYIYTLKIIFYLDFLNCYSLWFLTSTPAIYRKICYIKKQDLPNSYFSEPPRTLNKTLIIKTS